MRGFLGFIDRYVWEIAWRSTFESLLVEEGMAIVAIRIGRSILWFDGEYT